MNQSQSPLPPDAEAPQKSALVAFFIFCVAAAFIFFVWVIYYYSWLHRPLGASVLVVQADRSWDGAIVHIEGIGTETHEAPIDGAGGYEVRMSLGKGSYTIRISRGTQVLLPFKPFDLDEAQVRTLKLPPAPTTLPSPRR